MRVVLPRDGRLLPTEEVCGIVIPPNGRVADFGRLVISPDRRSVQRQLFLGLNCRATQEVRAHGHLYTAGMVSSAVRRLYRLVGAPLDIMGPPRLFMGEERSPIRWDIAGSAGTVVVHLRHLLGEGTQVIGETE